MKRWLLAPGLTLALAAATRADDLPTPRAELVVQSGNLTEVTVLAFSPDGKLLGSGCSNNGNGTADPTAKLWDVKTGAEVRAFAPPDGLRSVAFDPRGKVIAASGPKSILLWDTATGKLRGTLSGQANWARRLAFSPDGRLLASDEAEQIRLWDARTGKELRRIKVPKDYKWFVAMAFSADGKTLAAASTERKIVLFDSGTGAQQRELPVPRDVISLAFGPEGSVLAAGLARGVADNAAGVATGLVWDLKTDAAPRQLAGHTDSVLSVAFSPDAKILATGGADKAARLWDVATGKEVGKIDAPAKFVHAVAFSPDSSVLAFDAGDSETADRITLWSIRGSTALRTLQTKTAPATQLAFSPDGAALAVGYAGRGGHQARLWDLAAERRVLALEEKADERGVRVAFSADGKLLATAGAGHSIHLWDSGTGALVRSIDGHNGPVVSLAFSKDGTLLASASDDATVRVWDATSGAEKLKLPTTQKPVAVALSPDGKHLAAGSANGTVWMWDPATGEVQPPLGQGAPVVQLAFSATGKHVAVSVQPEGSAGQIRLFDLKTSAKADAKSGAGREHVIDNAARFAFSPDGKTLAVASGNGVRLVSVDTRAPVGQIGGFPGGVRALAFSPDGKRLATGSIDNRVKLWDVASHKELASLVASGERDFLVATPEGDFVESRPGLEGAAFRSGNAALGLEQLDLTFDRPDVVEKRLGFASLEQVRFDQHLVEKRLARLGLQAGALAQAGDAPSIELASPPPPAATDERTLKLQVKAHDGHARLDRLLVEVNGVPALGPAGVDLRKKKAADATEELRIELGKGKNRIEIAALNQRGARSTPLVLEISYDGPSAPPDLYLIAIGVSDYGPDSSRNLTWAAKDAEDLAALYGAKKDRFGAVKVLKLTNKDATRRAILAARETLAQAKTDDEVVLFVAGQTIQEKGGDFFFAPSDVDFTSPLKSAVSFDALEDLLGSTPSRKRLLLVDARQYSEGAREEARGNLSLKTPEGTINARAVSSAGIPSPAAARGQLAEELDAIRERTGAVVIGASGGVEYGVDEWQNGVFAYSILQGLKSGQADLDKSGDVRASELRDYVQEKVRQLTGGRQLSTAWRENPANDFSVY